MIVQVAVQCAGAYDVVLSLNFSDISCQRDRMATLINHLYTQKR